MNDITTKVIAINPKYQSVVNKAVNWMVMYELANDQRNIASDNSEYDYEEDDKLWRKWDRRCIHTYDKPQGKQAKEIQKAQYWWGFYPIEKQSVQ